ncbi:hypothetical protein [Streptomyces roseifaciens]|uniref:hypothetical protein n=1 Tax=Streptomyces roseifaciens TaxID=1488406 RepID=UPI0007180DA1|nr:hypothetical protein [Streptomyces roseifaciens]
MGRITVVVEDLVFGEITIVLDTGEGSVEVGGGWLPRTTLRRGPGTAPTSWPPIGTSDPDGLTLTLDGEGEPPALSRGYVNRRTYTVRFPDGGRTYRLVPHDETRSCLMRGKVLLGELRVSPGGGHVTPATWRSASKVLPAEAALGYALAVGLGTGGKRSEGGSSSGGSAADAVLDILVAWP